MKRLLTIIAISVSMHIGASAQVNDNPHVNADSSVTFTATFPNAKKVLVSGTFYSKEEAKKHNIKYKKKGYVMTRSGDTWTCTTQPLESEMYAYRYIVDGKKTLDPTCTRITRDIADTLNYFFIGGKVADYYIDRDIPHGRIDKIWYPSTLNGMSQRRMFVYTPFGYDDDSNRQYPVLYLLHGSGGDETAWADYGRVCQILDYMIHSGQCLPLIVVMPNGNMNLDAAPGESPWMNKQPSANNTSSMFGKVEAHFPEEIIAYAEKKYRIIADKDHRAIAGLSLGGLQTIFISANNPDIFGYVGLFSAQTKDITSLFGHSALFKMKRTQYQLQRWRNVFSLFGNSLPRDNRWGSMIECQYIYEDIENKLLRQFEVPPHLYYIAIGKDDFMMSAQLKKKFSTIRSILDSHNLPYEYHLTDGGHSWENWRKYLVDFLPKLFHTE